MDRWMDSNVLNSIFFLSQLEKYEQLEWFIHNERKPFCESYVDMMSM